MANPAPAATITRKSVTGFVTKLVGDGATYGFINDEIFFQQTNVIDGPASSGDRVFAECEYSELLPIKWNATSIKIIGRASAGPTPNVLDSDPRRQSRQGMLNQQQQPVQTTANQSVTGANTYQQHRQQRQPQQHDVNVAVSQAPMTVQQPIQQQPVPAMNLLDQATLNQQPEFFAPFAQQAPPLQDLQPFQHDMPMGPPKLEYTSQLGSAFVQNQFLPGALLPQQPIQQPMLPQHQSQTQQQQQPQQLQRQQNNYRDQRGNRGDTNLKGRFNDKNDRNQSNRGRNRIDKKYEQPRSSERENSANARSSRDSRDRSSGQGDNKITKREDSSSNRQSPVPHSTRSANNNSSDRGHSKSASRRYDSQNVPKNSILANLNGWNIRSRCSNSVHVPSDLKNVIVNAYLRLDIKNTPKPIDFKIEPAIESTAAPKVASNDETKSNESEATSNASKPEATESLTNNEDASQSSVDTKAGEQMTPPSSKSDTKLNHKYGVKVILITLPELESIYKKVFGNDLDSYSSESKTQPKLDEAISLLCNKSHNGGHSLIGGKFDPSLDGFVEGETNEFERYGKQPDLIATCRRVVQEQAGLDLGPCQGWSLVSTFLYNNKSEYFSPKSSIEYSYIYLPHIWTMTSNDLSRKSLEIESLQVEASLTTEDGKSDVKDDTKQAEVVSESAEAKMDPANETLESDQMDAEELDENPATQDYSVTLENIPDLKVIQLKSELDKRDIKYKLNAKKAELVLLLQESLSKECSQPTEDNDSTLKTEVFDEAAKDSIEEHEPLEEGEVAPEDDNTNDDDGSTAASELALTNAIDSTEKRKLAEMDDDQDQETKKLCQEDLKKNLKVDLIKEPFTVRARSGQNQLSTLSLHDAVQGSRHDQFELSVASTVLKEGLVQHLSEYIFTTLVEDFRQKSKDTSDTASNSSSLSNSQDTNSDTNNNHTSTKQPSTSSPSTNASHGSADKANSVKEYPVDRYLNLAFSFFDLTHMGYVQADDLFKLFNNTGLTISKRALWSLIGEGEKFNYKTLPDLLAKLPPNHTYHFPDQFNRLPGSSLNDSNSSPNQKGLTCRMIEYQGVKYDVEKLIQQVKDAELGRVNIVQRFNDAISKHDHQESEIHALETNQLSLSKSIKSLNAEITELKREKSLCDKRVESLKKQIKDAVKILNE